MKTAVEEVMKELMYRGDGPVTPYVAIARAVRMTRQNPEILDDDIASGLYLTLAEIEMEGGYLPSDE